MPDEAYRFPYSLREQKETVSYLNCHRQRPAGWLLWSDQQLDDYLTGGLDEGIRRDLDKGMLHCGSRAVDHIYELLREGKRDGDQG